MKERINNKQNYLKYFLGSTGLMNLYKLSEQNFTIIQRREWNFESGVLKSGLRAEGAAGSACEEQDKQGENPFNASNQAGGY